MLASVQVIAAATVAVVYVDEDKNTGLELREPEYISSSSSNDSLTGWWFQKVGTSAVFTLAMLPVRQVLKRVVQHLNNLESTEKHQFGASQSAGAHTLQLRQQQYRVIITPSLMQGCRRLVYLVSSPLHIRADHAVGGVHPPHVRCTALHRPAQGLGVPIRQ